MRSVLEARVNVCVEVSRSVGSSYLFAGLTLKEALAHGLVVVRGEGDWCPAGVLALYIHIYIYI